MKNKNNFLLLFLLLFSSLAVAQRAENYVVQKSAPQTLVIDFFSGKILSEEIKTSEGTYSFLMMDDFHISSDPGKPALPTMVKLFEMPFCDNLQITVIPGEYDVVDAASLGIFYPVFPAQLPSPKSYDGEMPFVKDELLYNTDAFYGDLLVKVEKNGLLRDVNMGTVYCSPVQYNPVRHQFKIYRSVRVEILFENADLPATLEMKKLHGNSAFTGVKSQVINPISIPTKDVLTTAPIKYLIVSDRMFEESLTPFIQWKKRKGFIVEAAYTDDPIVGTTTTSIQNYIKSHYTNATPENPAPTYVLLVGDVEQIPAFRKSGHVSDLDYFTWTDGDDLPDCYYGRFSAQNVSQLLPQIEKTLLYEQYLMSDPDYLDDAIMIAGYDSYFAPQHGNGQVNYLSNYYFKTDNGYVNIHKYLHDCRSQANTIRSIIYDGVGFANFTAHCSSAGWSQPDFLVSHIPSMNNAGKYGLMIGNCCESSAFDVGECFAEAVLRAPEKGAVAYIGASNSSYWDEDFYWAVGLRSSISANPTYNSGNLGVYDRLFHLHGEPYSDWYTTNGALITAGNLSVQSSTSYLKQYYWEVYHLMGDPSLMTYLSKPSVMTVTSPAVLQLGMSSFSVHAVPHAYVALTFNNQLVTAGFADQNGDVTLVFDPLLEIGDYELAVSAQNYIHYFQSVTVIPAQGSYVTAQGIALSENTVPKGGAELFFDMEVKNFGVDRADGVYVKMSSLSDEITFLEDSVFIGDLDSNQSINLTVVFHSKLLTAIEDQQVIPVLITVHNGSQILYKDFSFDAIAPRFLRNGYRIEEYQGNNNGSIEPGETVRITFEDVNIGHLEAFYTYSALVSHYTKAMVQVSQYVHYDVPERASTQAVFYVKIADEVPLGTIIPLYYRIRSGDYITDDTIGLKLSGEIEDFETNSFTKYHWDNSGTNPWILTTTAPYNGTYCARSASNLGHNKTSVLEITIDVPYNDEISFYRKVSSEINRDFFKFYIDGDIKEAKSGTVPWEQVRFPVTKGMHTFRFEYAKDISLSSGSDCVWIDNIVLPGVGTIAPQDTIVDFPINILKYEDTRNVLLYPNPAFDRIWLETSEMVKEITIIDLNGKEVFKMNVSQATMFSIDVSSLTRGFYLVKIEFNDQRPTIRKFIKQ